ncbi:phosphatase PAP2 family protein [Streptomyces sp. NPDC050145]|uniref:phosphatase PAP2 family protein n=1 Tax=Streptomyces sp. NPDC050145 TaxID=3365602 RepID=UPI0037A733DA
MSRKDVADLLGSVALGAWAAFGVLAMAVVGQGRSALWLDDGFLLRAAGHRQEVVTALARGVTATGTGVVPYILAALAGVVAARTGRRRLCAAGLSLAVLGAGQALRYGAMELVHRPRPPHSFWAGHASAWSFPSGHATTSALAAGLLIAALRVRAPRGGTVLRVAVACWGTAVGLSRVFLGVHWFTDVLGGWLFAAGWLGICLCLAARLLPDAFFADPNPPPTTAPAEEPRETHASEDPCGGGRSRAA